MKVSVVINTLNAEKFLAKVLDAVKDFDEILICDMHSEDQTIAIAEKYNAKVIYHEKTGFVEPARNYALSQATNPWVLLLDADEVITEDFKKFIEENINENTTASCFAIPRKNYFLGKFMRSAYPDYVYRLFKRDAVFWPEFIHSIPTIKGHIVKIDSSKTNLALEHLADDSVFQITSKNNTYSTAEIPKRKHKKISSFKLLFSPLLWFFKYYILKKGFLDGKEGFIFAVLKSQYKFLTLAKLIEYQKNGHH